MKWKVIGWSTYDYDEYPDGENTLAICNAIVDEVKRKKYYFTGEEHQDDFECVPVLNDGKKYCFTRRGWGQIMADSLDQKGPFDYSLHADLIQISKRHHCPSYEEADVDVSEIVDDLSELNETFSTNVSVEEFENFKENGFLYITDDDSLRYLDKGDTLIIKCDETEVSKIVADVWKERYLTDEIKKEIEHLRNSGPIENYWKSNELESAQPIKLKIYFKKEEAA